MKYANEIFFLVFALILWGLLYGSRFILTSGKAGQSEKLWLTALTLTATTFTLFALASTISLFLLTLANTCFIASFIYFGLFCRSLNGPIPKNVNILILVGLLAFAALFEYLRQTGLFIERVGLISLVGASCFIWELKELRRFKGIGSTQLRFLVYTIAIELALTVARLVSLYIDGGLSTPNLYQEGGVSASIRWAWLGISILSYVAVLGYWLEKLTIENIQVASENKKITELLKEKESLIYGLLKANRTSATGALSASIAHELNQPLAASNVNIQFLQMKLGKNELSPELGGEVLASLQSDNKRAADIIRSLRSIFMDTNIDTQSSDINELINDIFVIIRPELKSNNIALNVELCDLKDISMNRGEIQQVILNLLNNAIQSLASSEMANKAITISSIVHADTLRLSVADNGAGVPENRQNNLFELLSSTKQTGMGLGLWLCQHIVTRHGGRLWHEVAQGGGANFVMELPTNR